MKILFTGGGTGGHVLPVIAVAREIRKGFGNKDLKLFYMGPKDDFGKMMFSQEGIGVKTIFAGKIRRYFSFFSLLQNLADVFLRIPLGIIQSFFYLFFLAPDLIFSKGGYGSLPVVLAGWIFRVPILLHESDVSPGLSNRILSRFAAKVFISFPAEKTEYFSPEKITETGNPVRKEIFNGTREGAREIFNLSFEKPVILILGGSQGAQRINDKILEILPDLSEGFEVIHQCGEKNFSEVKSEAKAILPPENTNSYFLFSFLKEEELKQAYAAADLIVSRAGSGSIFEIAAAGKPSLLIPLPESAQNHQVKNAYAYAEKGASIVMEEANFTPRFFLEKLKEIFSRPSEMEKMRQAALKFSKPEAAKLIAEHIEKYVKSR